MSKKLRNKIKKISRHVSKIKKLKHHREESFRCKKCGDRFPTTLDLQFHVNEIHNRKSALREIRLLEQGFVPDESKLGMPFKGRNRVIIA
jgi:uncharacterized C2H2 Zn-finger protein